MRVVIAEDSVLLREGLSRLLADAGHEIVATVGDGAEAEQVVTALTPDIVVMDVRMPPTHTDEGIRAALTIRRDHPTVAVLVLSQYVEQHYATELIAAETAGIGYLLKDRVADVGDFVRAVERVGAATDGRGPFERSDRGRARRQRRCRREARLVHLLEARSPAGRERSPPGARRAPLPRCLRPS